MTSAATLTTDFALAQTQAEARWPLQRMALDGGELTWREAGPASAPALVLLHGIGSGALSWTAQFEAFSTTHRVLAWDAPGYGASSPLASATPLAPDYAAVLHRWMQHLGLVRATAGAAPLLLGHSLGALIAAAWSATAGAGAAAQGGAGAARALVLASPARGYGDQPPAVQQQKWQERVALVQQLGVQGMAEQRSANLLSAGATPAMRSQVQANMARVTARGYGQAAHLLAHDQLLHWALHHRGPRAVLCGEADRVTPPDACEAIAEAWDAPFVRLPQAGHACYIEAPQAFNTALRNSLQAAGTWP